MTCTHASLAPNEFSKKSKWTWSFHVNGKSTYLIWELFNHYKSTLYVRTMNRVPPLSLRSIQKVEKYQDCPRKRRTGRYACFLLVLTFLTHDDENVKF